MRKFENLPELPAAVFRKILPYVRTKDMPRIEKAVQSSPGLYNEFSYFTKKHCKKN